MLDITNALLSVFLIIALGTAIRQLAFKDAESWRLVDRLNYFVFFPALLTQTLARADLGQIAVGSIAATLLLGLGSGVVLVLAPRPLTSLPGPRYSSLFQGSLRWNGFVALATVAGLGLEGGVAIFAIAVALIVPTINMLSVIVLTRTHESGPAPVARIPGLLIRNPLILACAAGIVLSGQTTLLDSPLGEGLGLLGRAALPLGLIGVGAGLDLSSLKRGGPVILFAIGLKLIVMPLIFAAWATFFGITGDAFAVIVICASVPTATSSYVLARQLGGDAALMAAIVTASTLGAVVTMPVMLWLLT